MIVIRRMKPLGFSLDQMRDLLDVTDRLDSGDPVAADERRELLRRLREYETASQERVTELRVQLARAEDFAKTLAERIDRAVAPED
nr:MerR family DNA-binding protein [Actinopolymorpha rutila]